MNCFCFKTPLRESVFDTTASSRGILRVCAFLRVMKRLGQEPLSTVPLARVLQTHATMEKQTRLVFIFCDDRET